MKLQLEKEQDWEEDVFRSVTEQIFQLGSEHGSFVCNNGSKALCIAKWFVLYVLTHSVKEELEEVKESFVLSVKSDKKDFDE